jgi:xylose isomerase
VTCFVPPGYHHEVANEDMVEKTRRVCDRLFDLLDGLEYNSRSTTTRAKSTRTPRRDPLRLEGARQGVLLNSHEKLRRRGIDTLKRGIDLSAEVGANFMIWPGAEGYNYTFRRSYAETWKQFFEGVADLPHIQHDAIDRFGRRFFGRS